MTLRKVRQRTLRNTKAAQHTKKVTKTGERRELAGLLSEKCGLRWEPGVRFLLLVAFHDKAVHVIVLVLLVSVLILVVIAGV